MEQGARYARSEGQERWQAGRAGRKPSKRTKTVELSEEATRDLLRFIDDLNLDPWKAHQLVSTLVSDVLCEHGDEWREIFGNTLRSRVQDPPVSR